MLQQQSPDLNGLTQQKFISHSAPSPAQVSRGLCSSSSETEADGSTITLLASRTEAIPTKKKCKKAKWLSGEALQMAAKRREAKSKGEKERYTNLNAEFQRIVRTDKKAFLRDQCKEIEENHRMGKTRDLFKKIRNTKGNFHAKMGTTKDRNGMDRIHRRTIQKKYSFVYLLFCK